MMMMAKIDTPTHKTKTKTSKMTVLRQDTVSRLNITGETSFKEVFHDVDFIDWSLDRNLHRGTPSLPTPALKCSCMTDNRKLSDFLFVAGVYRNGGWNYAIW